MARLRTIISLCTLMLASSALHAGNEGIKVTDTEVLVYEDIHFRNRVLLRIPLDRSKDYEVYRAGQGNPSEFYHAADEILLLGDCVLIKDYGAEPLSFATRISAWNIRTSETHSISVTSSSMTTMSADKTFAVFRHQVDGSLGRLTAMKADCSLYDVPFELVPDSYWSADTTADTIIMKSDHQVITITAEGPREQQ